MGRRPDYFGGSSIEYTKKGKHYNCMHRSQDGDCMNRDSQWFGEMCKNAVKCNDYSEFRISLASRFTYVRIKGKTVAFLPKKSNVVSKGDLVLFYISNKDKDVEYIMDLNDDKIWDLVLWAIGKSIGSTRNYNGNVYQIKSIKSRCE